MYRLLIWCVASFAAWHLAPVAAVVGGNPASPPEPDAAVVFTQRFGRSSRVEGFKDEKLGYYSFFGIRYAEPPVGPRRFQRPVRRYLAGEMLATKQCLPCPQKDPSQPGRIMGSEDCLCLNVYAPKMPATEEGSPVVFYIHGGNYKSGSTGSYGGQHLNKQDTILVTAQYRLGSLGYLSTGQRDAAGNVGLYDLHTAMIWIQDYIQFFGGDPKRIIVMGQGSGGSAASLLAMSPEGRSAAGVVALSGAPLSPGAVRPDPAKHAEALADRTGCPRKPAESLLICLRKLPMEELVQADEDLDMDMVEPQRFVEEISGRSGAGARVEGSDDLRGLPPIVTEQPADSLKKKEKRVPLLTGVTSAETSRAVFGKYNKFLSGQLQNVKDFIKKDVIGGLKNVVQGVEGLIPIVPNVQGLLPISDYYQGVFEQSFKVIDGLAEIVEATSDALFNLPAYQTVQSWSEGGPAFLYSFEHVGNLTKGWHFLPGVALAEKSDYEPKEKPKKAQGPAHGDELAYIFEPLDADGQPIRQDISGTDAKVRENFVGLISKFAHGFGKEDKKNGSTLFGILPFQKDSKDQFLKITDSITVDKNFRFCQLGLWGNMADRLTGALCKNLFGNLLNLAQLPVAGQLTDVAGQLTGQGAGQLGNVPNQLGNVPNQLGNVPNQLGNVLNPTQIMGQKQQGQMNVPLVSGLLGSGSRTPQRPQQRPTTQNSFRIPFDF